METTQTESQVEGATEVTATEVTATEVTPQVEVTEPVKAKVAKAVKQPKFLIMQDSAGVELDRKVLGRGRPATGSTVDADGNRVITGCERLADGSIKTPTTAKAVKSAVEVNYITVDENGSEVARERKGRGRTRPGYVLHTSGDFAGHFVGQQRKEAEATEGTEVVTSEVAEPQVEAQVEPVESSQEDVERIFA